MRNFVKVLLAFLLVAVAGYGVYTSQTKTELSDVMLENVEALADFEWDENGWYCWKESYDDGGSAFFTYIRCFDCNVSSAVSVQYQAQCWYHYLDLNELGL